MKTNIGNENFTGFHAHSETRSLNVTIGLRLLRRLQEVSRGLGNQATPVDLQYPLLFDSINIGLTTSFASNTLASNTTLPKPRPLLCRASNCHLPGMATKSTYPALLSNLEGPQTYIQNPKLGVRGAPPKVVHAALSYIAKSMQV